MFSKIVFFNVKFTKSFMAIDNLFFYSLDCNYSVEKKYLQT